MMQNASSYHIPIRKPLEEWLLELRLRAAHHQVAEGRPVKAPHLRVILRRNGRRPGTAD